MVIFFIFLLYLLSHIRTHLPWRKYKCLPRKILNFESLNNNNISSLIGGRLFVDVDGNDMIKGHNSFLIIKINWRTYKYKTKLFVKSWWHWMSGLCQFWGYYMSYIFVGANSQLTLSIFTFSCSKFIDERSCFDGFEIPLLQTKILLHWALLTRGIIKLSFKIVLNTNDFF